LKAMDLSPSKFKRSCRFLCLAGALLALSPKTARGAEPDEAAVIAQGVKESALALSESRPAEAIRSLESLADRGMSHPDLSFNRGLAYASRATAATSEVGDLGQAVAGFAEALHLRPGDKQAERAVRQTQLLVAKKAAGDQTSSENDSLGLIEKTLQGLSPFWLFVLAALGSVAASGGSLLRLSTRETIRLSGLVTAGIGVFLLFGAGSLFLFRQTLFDGARQGVVIAPEARLVDESGAQLKGVLPYRESTIVHIGPPRRGLAPLVSLGQIRWIRTTQVRFLGPN
jgi:hypothetical protein